MHLTWNYFKEIFSYLRPVSNIQIYPELKIDHLKKLPIDVWKLLFVYFDAPFKEWKNCCILNNEYKILFTESRFIDWLFQKTIKIRNDDYLPKILDCAQLSGGHLRHFHLALPYDYLKENSLSLNNSHLQLPIAQLSPMRKFLERLHAQNSSIESLTMNCFPLQDEDLQFIAEHFKNLKSLNVERCSLLTNDGLFHLPQLLFLEILILKNCNFSDAGCESISLLNLKHLNISHNYKITEVGFKHFSKLRLLEILDVNCSGCNDKALVYIPTLPHLETLNADFHEYSDEGVNNISASVSLRVLILSSNEITDVGCRYLSRLSLRFLKLDSHKITNQGLKDLSRIHSLEFLHLSGLKINDESLTLLLPLVLLKHLNLSCSEITDKGLILFTKFPLLKKLMLACCPKITDAGRQHLRELLPGVKIYDKPYFRYCETDHFF